LQTMNFK